MNRPDTTRGELLLELLSEEIPAWMQRRAIEDLTALVRDKLTAAEIPAATLSGYVTPRRLTLIAQGIPERQPDRSEERRGPRLGAPPAALDGFLRAAGLQSIDQCEVRDTGRGEFYFAKIERPGGAASEALPELLRAAIGELPWPKSMRYPASSLRWVRPLTSAICLFNGEILPLALDQVPVGRVTRGHRFLSQGEISVDNAADYLERLEAAYVILDHNRRREKIKADLKERAAAEGLRVKPDLGLLEEVTGLVEFPVVLIGAIHDEFVQPLPDGLPPEVLATAMRTHQKYFSCLKPDRTPAPRFLFVANNRTADDGKTIVAGNERVLRARLADARFFWDQDTKVRLEDRVEALKQRIFHAALGQDGTLLRKVIRIEALADFLAPSVGADRRLACRAAYLAKADLSTGMVGEFPELQGIMGRYYALHDGEDPIVADAIAEHYKPLGPNDICPTAPESVAIAIADKIDSLVAFFATGDRPTGSRDPFALRRAGLGLIRLIREGNLRISLAEAFERAANLLYPDLRKPLDPDATLIEQARQRWQQHLAEVPTELLEFIADRLKADLRDHNARHDLVAAVFRRAGRQEIEDDLVRLLARLNAVMFFLALDDGQNLLTAYRRASNIVAIEERRDNRAYDDEVDPALLRQPEEKALAHALDLANLKATEAIAEENFHDAMAALASLRQPVDAFFDKVTVNTDEAALRENRLRLLSRIRAVMNQVADFSQIEG